MPPTPYEHSTFLQNLSLSKIMHPAHPCSYKYNFKYYIFPFDLEAETWLFYRNHKPPTPHSVSINTKWCKMLHFNIMGNVMKPISVQSNGEENHFSSIILLGPKQTVLWVNVFGNSLEWLGTGPMKWTWTVNLKCFSGVESWQTS